MKSRVGDYEKLLLLIGLNLSVFILSLPVVLYFYFLQGWR